MHYHKIDTLFDRGPDFKVDTTKLRRPEFGLIKEWYIEEKIDGMSVGFVYTENWGTDRHLPETFFGRTANTNWNAKNKEFMQIQHDAMYDKAHEIIEQYHLTELRIYGELYGPGIQNGGGYRDDLGFVCFDMTADGTWLNVADRNANAERMGIDVPHRYATTGPPWAGTTVLWGALGRNILTSRLAADKKGNNILAEGVIARPPVNLYDQRGARVMWKLKGKDF